MTTTAGQELLDLLKVYKKELKCAAIESKLIDGGEAVLKVGFTKKQLKEFLAKLDFVYDSGFGEQHITGMLWFCDETWAVRSEYDGQEWWSVQSVPQIDKRCI